MTRPIRPARTTRADSRRGRGARRTLGVLLALAVVSTAHAPSVLTVRPGDTLWELARKHGTTEAALRRLNDLPGNGTIYAGDTLRLPAGSSSSSSAGSSGSSAPRSVAGSHVVRSGETLSHLAVRYGTTSAAIRRANGLSGSTLQVGRRLAIPGATSAASVPTTNAGKRIPGAVRRSVAENRRILASRSHPSKAKVRRMVAATARRHGVSPTLALSVAYHESGFQQRVVSGVNAIGVMQVLPSTGRVLARQHSTSLDLLDTQDNITAGVLLLRQLNRSTGSENRTLAAYYQGLGSIARQGLLPQTHQYIRSISALKPRFARG